MFNELNKIHRSSRISKMKVMYRQQAGFLWHKDKDFNQSLGHRPTIRLNKLKMQLNEYLQIGQIQDKSLKAKKAKSQPSMKGNKGRSKLQLSLCNSLNPFSRQHGTKQARRGMDQYHRPAMTFDIKEIKTQLKQRAGRQQRILPNRGGNTVGSYYQIVAIHKNFDKSKYFDAGKSPHFLEHRQSHLNSKYYSRIRDIASQNYKNTQKSMQVQPLEPWFNQQEAVIDF